MSTSDWQQQWLISHAVMWGDRSHHSTSVHASDAVSCWKLAYSWITNQWVRVIFRFKFHVPMISDSMINLCDNTATVKNQTYEQQNVSSAAASCLLEMVSSVQSLNCSHQQKFWHEVPKLLPATVHNKATKYSGSDYCMWSFTSCVW